MAWKKHVRWGVALSVAAFAVGCGVGEDAALFNGVNELTITGNNTGAYDFDHVAVRMITHFHTTSSFAGLPAARISQKWSEKDDQGNVVELDSTGETFWNVLEPGDYYGRSFIDLNRNSELDDDEPYDEWLTQEGQRKVIEVREESRWKLTFRFDSLRSDWL
jgi:hypothetical protein